MVTLFILFTERKNPEKVETFTSKFLFFKYLSFQNVQISVAFEDLAYKFEYKMDENSKNVIDDFAATQAYNFNDCFDSSDQTQLNKKLEMKDNNEQAAVVSSQDLEDKEEKKNLKVCNENVDEDDLRVSSSKKLKLEKSENDESEMKPESDKISNDLIDIINCSICCEIMHDCIW